MKKLIILFVLIGGGYLIYNNIFSPQVNYDDNGHLISQLFTADNCKPCDDAVGLLKKRGVSYEEINISRGNEQQSQFREYGGQSLPLLVVGSQQFRGYDRAQFVSVLARSYGWDVLSRTEKMAMSCHFDEQGKPLVVIYGTEHCVYCKNAEQFFKDSGIDIKELDIETSSDAHQSYRILEGNGTPLIYIGFYRVDGFNRSELKKAIAAEL